MIVRDQKVSGQRYEKEQGGSPQWAEGDFTIVDDIGSEAGVK